MGNNDHRCMPFQEDTTQVSRDDSSFFVNTHSNAATSAVGVVSSWISFTTLYARTFGADLPCGALGTVRIEYKVSKGAYRATTSCTVVRVCEDVDTSASATYQATWARKATLPSIASIPGRTLQNINKTIYYTRFEEFITAVLHDPQLESSFWRFLHMPKHAV